MNVLKLSGFLESSKVLDIVEFVKQVKTTDSEVFLSLKKEGPDKNQFTGIVFVIVKSKFDCNSIFTLHNKRYQNNFINVCTSRLEEMDGLNLFPKPDPKLFDMIRDQTNLGVVDIQPTTLDRPSPLLITEPKPQKATAPCIYIPDLYLPTIIKTEDTHDVAKDLESSMNGYRTGIIQPLQDLHYGYFVKMFYIDPNLSDDEIVSFITKCGTPLAVMHYYYDAGPHCGKKRGEVFILTTSTTQAFKFAKLTGSQLGKCKISVVFPSKEEIDSVICQNSYNNDAPESDIVQEPVETIQDNYFPENLFENTSDAVNLAHIRSYNEKRLESPKSTDIKNQTISDSITDTVILVKNAPKNVTSKEIIGFFRSVPFIKSSVKKRATRADSSQWLVSFKFYTQALDASYKLNYKLLKGRPIELEILK